MFGFHNDKLVFCLILFWTGYSTTGNVSLFSLFGFDVYCRFGNYKKLFGFEFGGNS